MDGAKLKDARKQAGFSLDALARTSGHPASTIARWERGAHDPAFETVCHLARLLGKPVEWFCEEGEA